MQPTVLENVLTTARSPLRSVRADREPLPVATVEEALARRTRCRSLARGTVQPRRGYVVKLALASTRRRHGQRLDDYRLDSMPFGGIKNSGLGRRDQVLVAGDDGAKVICWYLPRCNGRGR